MMGMTVSIIAMLLRRGSFEIRNQEKSAERADLETGGIILLRHVDQHKGEPMQKILTWGNVQYMTQVVWFSISRMDLYGNEKVSKLLKTGLNKGQLSTGFTITTGKQNGTSTVWSQLFIYPWTFVMWNGFQYCLLLRMCKILQRNFACLIQMCWSYFERLPIFCLSSLIFYFWQNSAST